MREYEFNFVIQPEISDEGSKAILDRLDGILADSEAIRLLCDDLGKRKLAYEVRNFQKGHYYILSFLDSGSVVPALERALKLEESVLRFLTIKVSDLVTDIEGRRAEAKEKEAELQRRAAEKAAREAEEAKARAEAEERAAAAAAAAAAEAEAASEAGEADPAGEAEEAAGADESEGVAEASEASEEAPAAVADASAPAADEAGSADAEEDEK